MQYIQYEHKGEILYSLKLTLDSLIMIPKVLWSHDLPSSLHTLLSLLRSRQNLLDTHDPSNTRNQIPDNETSYMKFWWEVIPHYSTLIQHISHMTDIPPTGRICTLQLVFAAFIKYVDWIYLKIITIRRHGTFNNLFDACITSHNCEYFFRPKCWLRQSLTLF